MPILQSLLLLFLDVEEMWTRQRARHVELSHSRVLETFFPTCTPRLKREENRARARQQASSHAPPVPLSSALNRSHHVLAQPVRTPASSPAQLSPAAARLILQQDQDIQQIQPQASLAATTLGRPGLVSSRSSPDLRPTGLVGVASSSTSTPETSPSMSSSLAAAAGAQGAAVIVASAAGPVAAARAPPPPPAKSLTPLRGSQRARSNSSAASSVRSISATRRASIGWDAAPPAVPVAPRSRSSSRRLLPSSASAAAVTVASPPSQRRAVTMASPPPVDNLVVPSLTQRLRPPAALSARTVMDD